MTQVAQLFPAPVHQESISHLTTAWLRAISEQPEQEFMQAVHR